ncbi:MAG: hypothetical protein ABIT04_05445 [Novosphingobium sp.]
MLDCRQRDLGQAGVQLIEQQLGEQCLAKAAASRLRSDRRHTLAAAAFLPDETQFPLISTPSIDRSTAQPWAPRIEPPAELPPNSSTASQPARCGG